MNCVEKDRVSAVAAHDRYKRIDLTSRRCVGKELGHLSDVRDVPHRRTANRAFAAVSPVSLQPLDSPVASLRLRHGRSVWGFFEVLLCLCHPPSLTPL